MHRLTVLLTALTFSMLAAFEMAAQNVQVKGRVTDTAGEPLVAVADILVPWL